MYVIIVAWNYCSKRGKMKVLMKGNEAIGEAAIRAGCKNYFAYPITPQSEVAEYMCKRLPEVGGVFLQGESEVAVSYMIYGVAGAGERVFTTSSSPGISLMGEGISYAAGAELPIVYVNIQRGGPGLGGILPGQSDYLQATCGIGHGDFKLLVLAPATVQEMAEMMMDAFELADKYRNPIMILGDGMLGQMMEPVEFPEKVSAKSIDKNSWATNGMATRGTTKRNLVKSLFLAAEQLHAHNIKLAEKYKAMKENEIRYATYNTESEYEILLAAYGTSSRVCQTAIDLLKEEKIEAALFRPQTVWPFPEKALFDLAQKSSCKAVVSVEMSMGQMVKDVDHYVYGTKPVTWFGKAGGAIPSPEEVAAYVKKVLNRS